SGSSGAVVAKNEQNRAGLVQLFRQDDGRDQQRGAGAIEDTEREGEARHGDDERADPPHEASTAILLLRGAKRSREVTDRAPSEHGSENDQAVDDQRCHGGRQSTRRTSDVALRLLMSSWSAQTRAAPGGEGSRERGRGSRRRRAPRG